MSHYQKFKIPASWIWTNIGELLENRDAERVPVSSAIRKKQSNKIYDYYGAAGVIDKVDGYLFDERLLLIGEDGANLLSRAKDNAFFAEGKYWVNNHAHILDSKIKSILDYVAIVVNSYNLEPFITGSAQPKLSQDNLNSIPIPLPPLAEQNRILFAIQTVMEAVARINIDKAELSASVTLAKSKILELAMQGKLVQQDPADEPAADLLRRVNPNARIITDNPHSRNLPNSWCEVRIIDLFHKMKREIPSGQKFKYIDIDSIDNKTNIAYPKEIEVVKAPSRASRHTKKGDIVFSMVRPYLRNIAKVPFEGCIASTGFYVFSPTCAINKEFAFQLLLSPMVVNGLNTFMKGDNSPSINKDNVENNVVPLPPLNEQLRICERLGYLYQLLDEIEASLQS